MRFAFIDSSNQSDWLLKRAEKKPEDERDSLKARVKKSSLSAEVLPDQNVIKQSHFSVVLIVIRPYFLTATEVIVEVMR